MTLAIYCAGGLGKEIIALARTVCRWENIIFVDDVTDDEWYQGAKVFRFDEVKDFPDEVEFVIANGEPEVREMLYNKIKEAGYKMTTIYGPGCSILPGAQIGEGCILFDCGVSADVVIAHNVLINTKVVIGHDAVIGAHSIVSAFCFIGGYTKLGNKVYMAPGSMAKDRIIIGESAIISFGAVLLRNVKSNVIMVGNPAKRLADNIENKVFNMFETEK